MVGFTLPSRLAALVALGLVILTAPTVTHAFPWSRIFGTGSKPTTPTDTAASTSSTTHLGPTTARTPSISSIPTVTSQAEASSADAGALLPNSVAAATATAATPIVPDHDHGSTGASTSRLAAQILSDASAKSSSSSSASSAGQQQQGSFTEHDDITADLASALAPPPPTTRSNNAVPADASLSGSGEHQHQQRLRDHASVASADSGSEPTMVRHQHNQILQPGVERQSIPFGGDARSRGEHEKATTADSGAGTVVSDKALTSAPGADVSSDGETRDSSAWKHSSGGRGHDNTVSLIKSILNSASGIGIGGGGSSSKKNSNRREENEDEDDASRKKEEEEKVAVAAPTSIEHTDTSSLSPPSSSSSSLSSSSSSSRSSRRREQRDRSHHIDHHEDADGYAAIRREIEELSRRLGPSAPAAPAAPARDVVAEHAHATGGSTLVRGIEDAITGLMHVYKALKNVDHSDSGMVTGFRRDGGESPPAGEDAMVPVAARDTRGSGLGDSDSSSSGGHSVAEGEHGQRSGDLMDATSREVQEGGRKDDDSTSTNDTGTGDLGSGAGTNQTFGTGGEGVVGEGRIVIEDGKSIDESGGGGLPGMVVLAGVVFVAALGVMAYGWYAGQENAAVPPTPLYPPRGPSFV